MTTPWSIDETLLLAQKRAELEEIRADNIALSKKIAELELQLKSKPKPAAVRKQIATIKATHQRDFFTPD